MSGFWITAALLLGVSLWWMCRPLWRADQQGRMTVLVTAVLFVASAVALYVTWSDWQVVDEPQADTPVGMVSRLARRLEKSPEDLEGWLMLGRSYAALEQYPLAQRAYRRALRLADGRNAEALLGLGETLVLQADGEIDELSSRLFEEALELEPNSEKALFFAAIAAQRRGDRALAVDRYQRMLGQNPPDNIRAIIDAQVRALGGTPAAVATSEVLVNVSIRPELAGEIRAESMLFVFIRRVGESGPPLAAQRVPAKLPLQVRLSDADTMLPGVSFGKDETVEVSARIALSGDATPRSGDPIGRVTYTFGRDAGKALVIDGRTP